MDDSRYPKSRRRWYHLTPDRFCIGLLAVQVLLLLAVRYRWFAFNEKKGWTVLIALAVVCASVLVMMVWFVASSLVRRRLQFSVRSLLFFLVVVSIPLGWFAWELEKARQQSHAAEAISIRGGLVGYDFGWPLHMEPTGPAWLRTLLGREFLFDVDRVECQIVSYYYAHELPNHIIFGFRDAEIDPDHPFDDEDAVHLRQLPQLRMLDLAGTSVTDAGLTHMKGLTNIELLNLDGTQITDAGLENLNGLRKLKYLMIRDTHVTDNGLIHLTAMADLEELDLSYLQVTDAGLKQLRTMTSLTSLDLAKTRITDAGLEHLNELTNLRDLDLEGTKVTGDGLVHLKGLSRLRFIHLGGTQITDAKLEQLQGLASLQFLLLDNTQVSDSGVPHLHALTELEWIYLYDTQISDEAVEQLKQALPNCNISRFPRR